MSEFIPFDKNVEVSGKMVITAVNSFPEFQKEIGLRLFEESGIRFPLKEDNWYDQSIFLSALKNIAKEFGEHKLFEIGKLMPLKVILPSNVNTLEKAMKYINKAYHANHRNGDIGVYEFISFDREYNKITMRCRNPYPCDFDAGIITSIARKFKKSVNVTYDPSKGISRKEGGNESWYIISFQ